MGLVSFSTSASGQRHGFHLGNRVVDLGTIDLQDNNDESFLTHLDNLENRVWEALSADDPPATFDLDNIEFHKPTDPGKVIRFEGCYEQDLIDEGFNPHLEDAGLHELEWPSLWVAPKSSIAEPCDHIKLPPRIDDIRVGAELCLVVGERAKNRSPGEPLDPIAGCTIAIGLRAHDEIPGLEGYKMFDKSLTFGPQVVALGDVDLSNLDMVVRVNGELQDVRTTADWRFTPSELVSYASRVMSLEPGDLLMTGDPMRMDQSIIRGDRVSAWIEDVGSLSTNTIGDEDE